MTRIRTDFVSVKIRQIRVIRVLRRGKSAFIRVHLRLKFFLEVQEKIYNFRIVARVAQLMSLCDELEAGLMRSQADSEKLMEAVVGRMMAG